MIRAHIAPGNHRVMVQADQAGLDEIELAIGRLRLGASPTELAHHGYLGDDFLPALILELIET